MTYDELVAQIDKIIGLTEEQMGVYGLNIHKALRAVAELHQPSNKGCDWMPLNLCSICVEDPGDYEFARDVDYPCPTIQAIERELINVRA